MLVDHKTQLRTPSWNLTFLRFSLLIERPLGILLYLSFAFSRDWLLFSWRKSSDGQPNMYFPLTTQQIFYYAIQNRSSKSDGNPFHHFHVMRWQSETWLYLFGWQTLDFYPVLCVRGFLIAAYSWNYRSDGYLWSQLSASQHSEQQDLFLF